MKKEQLAEKLTGNEYGNELPAELETIARDNSLVVVYPYSDDNVEFRGAIDVEHGCLQGGAFYLVKKGTGFEVIDDDSVEQVQAICDGWGFEMPPYYRIDCLWCEDKDGEESEIAWQYKTQIPHATFSIMEDGEVWAIGIVFDLKELTREKSPELPGLIDPSNFTQDQKRQIIQAACEPAAQVLIHAMKMTGIENFIECGIEQDGKLYHLKLTAN